MSLPNSVANPLAKVSRRVELRYFSLINKKAKMKKSDHGIICHGDAHCVLSSGFFAIKGESSLSVSASASSLGGRPSPNLLLSIVGLKIWSQEDIPVLCADNLELILSL
jgi:hypothetical protein